MALSSTKRVVAGLRGFGFEQLKQFCEFTLGKSFRPRRSRQEYIQDLASYAAADSLAESLAAWCRAWAGPLQEEPRISQRGTVMVGPLGILQTAPGAARRGDEARAACKFLLDAITAHGLPAFADHLLGRTQPEVLRDVKALPGGRPQTLGYLQATMLATNGAIAVAVNEHIYKKRPIPVERFDLDSIDYLWKVTRWGLTVLPRSSEAERAFAAFCEEENTSLALACVLDRFGGALLRAAIASHNGPDELARISELVLIDGPARVVDRHLSDGSLWELLTSWGLHVPLNTPRNDMLPVLFREVGLRDVAPPRGLFFLRRQLADATQREVVLADGGSSVLRRVEACLESVYLAYFSLLIPEADQLTPRALSGDEGMKHLRAVGVTLAGRTLGSGGALLPFHSMSFGQKLDAFRSFLGIVQRSEAMTETLADLGRTPDTLRLLVGAQVGEIVRARNRLAHPAGEPPSRQDILEATIAALDVVACDDRAGPVPLLVRVLEETSDRHGWTKATLEDELGREIVSTSLDWDTRDKLCFLFSRTNPVAVNPRLVPV